LQEKSVWDNIIEYRLAFHSICVKQFAIYETF